MGAMITLGHHGVRNPDAANERINEMSDRWSRLAPLTGVLFVALVVAANVLTGSTPGSKATATKVITFYHSHRAREDTAAYLTGLSLFVGLFFYGLLRSHLRRVAATERLAAIAFAGAVLFAVGGGLSAGITLTLADVPTRLDASSAQALNLLRNDLTVFLLLAGIAVLLFASGLAIVRTALLPRWLGWFALAFGVVGLTPAGFVSFLAVGVWTLGVSIVLYMRAARPDAAATGEPSLPA